MNSLDKLKMSIDLYLNLRAENTARAAKRASELTGSDWAIMDDLAELFASRDVVHLVTAISSQLDKGLITPAEAAQTICDEAKRTLFRISMSGSTSTSLGANMITAAKPKLWAGLVEASEIWVAMTNDQ